jgi:hypothetical protein
MQSISELVLENWIQPEILHGDDFGHLVPKYCLFSELILFFDPTGQNPSISIKETANVY